MAGPALHGYPDLCVRSPVLAVLLSGLIYALPMAGWMRVRGMAWRPIVEMSGAVAVVIIGMAWVGVVTGSVCAAGLWAFAGRRAR